MDILKTISTTLAGVFKRHKAADPVDKLDILNLIDNNLITLRLVVESYDANAAVFKYIQTELLQANGANKDNTAARGLYESFFKALTPLARKQETAAILQSVYLAAKYILDDHQKLRDQFDALFKDGTDVGDVTLEQMKLSHATIFGFINLSSLLADWFCFFVGLLVGQSEEVNRIPAYRAKMVKESTTVVADFVSDVIGRGPQRGIITLVQSVRKAGDVAIYTDAAELDSYANINDYPGVSRLVNPFNAFQPILWVRESFTEFARWKYKRNLVMRDWMQAKIVVLRMDADRLAPASAEYQRQIQILQRYSDELAKLDKKIRDYETV